MHGSFTDNYPSVTPFMPPKAKGLRRRLDSPWPLNKKINPAITLLNLNSIQAGV